MPVVPHFPPPPPAGEWVIAITVLLAGGVVAWGLMVWLFARGLLRPPRMSDAKALRVLGRLTPEDLGLAYRAHTWTVRDEAGRPLKIAGWWMPMAGNSTRTVVLVHGFADAKVGAIAWAPVWQELGYNVAAVDLRAHGDSGGAVSTAGYFERHDLGQVLDQLRAEFPEATASLVLFGVSLGATVVAATAAGREDVAAVVLDSPHADYGQAVGAHAELLRLPGRWVSGPALRLCEWLTGARFAEVAPGVMVPRVRCPVLVVTGDRDPFCTPAVRERLAGWATVRVFAGAGHLMAMAGDAEGYREGIGEFLGAKLAAGAPGLRKVSVAE